MKHTVRRPVEESIVYKEEKTTKIEDSVFYADFLK